MTQYVINIGNLPNDGTGDPLRTAFNEVNLNFNQVWATGLVGSNIAIANNTILTTNTNGNLVLNPNGIGNIQANAHVLPDQNRIRNLGSSTRRWDTAYVQYADVGGTLTVSGDASITGNLSVTGNIVYIGNLITDAKTIQLANTAGTANAANGSGITVGANDNIATFLYNSADNAWVTNVRFETGNLILTDDRIMDLSGPSITNADLISGSTSGLDIVPNGDANATVLYNTYGNLVLQTSNTGSNVKTFTFGYDGNLIIPGAVSAVGNIAGNYFIGNGSQLTGITSYANANVVAYGEAGWSGNIIPTGNAVYNLGNSTNQWGDLFVSNATIYMNNIPISLTSANVLTVDGQPLLSNNSNTSIDTTGNLTANIISATGNVYGNNLSIASDAYVTGNITGSYFFGDASYMTGVITGNTLSDPVLYVANDTLTAPGLDGAGYAIGNAAGTLITMLYNNAANSLQFNRGLIPSANITSDIGNSTLWWNNLYTANAFSNTITTNNIVSPAGSNGNINLLPDGDGVVNIAGSSAILLHIAGETANTLNRVEVDTYGSFTQLGGGFTGTYSRGVPGAPEAVQSGDRLASFKGRGYDGTSLALPTGLISIDAADNWSVGNTPTRINFWTTAAGGNANINMQINPNGNVYVYNGNLIVTGGGGYLQGDDVSGNGGLYAGIPGFTPLGSNVVAQFAGNANSYSQINFQNINSGNVASGDIIITADNGNDSNNFIDMGIASSTWDGTQDNSLGTNVSANDGYLYVNGANLVVGTAVTGGAVNTWKFDNTGNLSVPVNINFNGGGIQQVLNEDFYVRVSDDEDDGWTLYNVVDDGAGNVFTQTSLDNSGFYVQTDVTGSNYQWNFNSNQGITNFPGNLQGVYGGNTSFYAYDNGSGGMVEMKTISYIGDTLLANVTVRHPNVTISTQNSLYNWTFDGTGNLTIPNSIHGTNSGAPIVIDAGATGDSLISIPSFTDGGEQLVIKNKYNSSQGIKLETETGNFVISGNSITFPDSTVQSTAYTGSTYGNSDVATFLAAFGSNAISTTGNITTGNLSVTGNVVGNIAFTGGEILINNATGAGGSDEGGELHFAAATANSTLSGPIAIDIYQSKMRFFETEGNTFGMYIDIANTAMGVAGSSLGVPAIGYRDVPQISLSANVTANVTNAGKHFYSTTAGNITLTIPDNANVAFPTGATLTIVMNAAGNVIVAQGTGVSLYMAGSSTTGNRVVGAYGLASVMKVATNTWVISGTGVY